MVEGGGEVGRALDAAATVAGTVGAEGDVTEDDEEEGTAAANAALGLMTVLEVATSSATAAEEGEEDAPNGSGVASAVAWTQVIPFASTLTSGVDVGTEADEGAEVAVEEPATEAHDLGAEKLWARAAAALP